MKHFLILLIMLGFPQSALPEVLCRASEFRLHGEYFLGGLFDVHTANSSIFHKRPEAVVCTRESFTITSYQMFQVMRFTVEEINNSTLILPNVSLGYDIFDHCSDVFNFPAILSLISRNYSVHVKENNKKHSTIIGVVGAFGSTETLTVAPLFMTNLIPMVSYGSASSVLSEKVKYPSFLRTVPSNKEMMKLVTLILKQFNWFWVAFIRSNDDYSKDALELFQTEIKDTEICLAYVEELNENSDHSKTFKSIEDLSVNVIIVFTLQSYAEALVQSAIKCNVGKKKVWIAGDGWSLNTRLPKEIGIERIGTVIGVTATVVTLPGFDNFIRKEQRKRRTSEQRSSGKTCNQACEVCAGLSAENIIAQNPSYSFAVYSAVYAMAHALHNVLQCDSEGCHDNVTVYPFMVLRELKKINFTLLNRNVQFDANGNPLSASYAVVFWNLSGHSEVVGSYETHPVVQFSVDSTKIQWYTKGPVPISRCSQECSEGYIRRQDGVHRCCFHCEVCPSGTYVNYTVDKYTCNSCKTTEWSSAGSTHCKERSVEYILFTEPLTILLMLSTSFMLMVTVAIAILFALKYDTPVVKSAGGPMCFLMLGCLNVCGISVFFFFGLPTHINCILRTLLFSLLYTPCLACFVVRAFQIVCIFKMASKFPKFNRWWVKYNGQWLVIAVSFVFQALGLLVGCLISLPKPFNDTTSYEDQIILSCGTGIEGQQIVYALLPMVLCILCFIFSYMGKDLPKNYNEAKAITFCLLLLILTWVTFCTIYILYHGKHISTFNAMSVLSSSYCIVLWYFLPKCYIIIFQPEKNTQQHFQGIIQSYTQNISKE